MLSSASTKNPTKQSKNELAKSIWTNVNELLILSKIVSACPLFIVFNPKRTSNRLYYSFQSIVQIIWSSIALASILFSYQYNVLNFWIVGPITIVKSLDFAENILNIGTIFQIIIGCNLTKKSYHKYIDSLAEIDYKIQTEYKISNRNICLFVRCSVTFVTINCLLVFSFIVISLQLNFGLTILICMVYLAPNTIHVMAMLQHCCLLLAMAERYKAIGKCLLSISMTATETVNCIENKRNLIVAATIPQTTSMLCHASVVQEKLRSLRRCYFELGQLAAQVNRTFGVLVVSQMATSFIVVCSQSYWFYLNISKSIPDRGVSTLVFSLLWIGMHFAKLSIVLLLCTRVSKMVNLCTYTSYLFIYILFFSSFLVF